MKFRRILVANRGEIASRVLRTAHALGFETVSVFAPQDQGLPYVREAEQAVRLRGSTAQETYLSISQLLAVAEQVGADAIHPGYGFLAENHQFARACAEQGVVFIGPTPDAIELMGSKQRAKRIAAEAGVPIIPGYQGDDQSDARLAREAELIGLPLLIKASAGGGGKGMRIIRDASELLPGIQAARREAEGAFADPTLLLERYIESPRHIEIQILGDQHGNLVHLFERECSIQRRHQKIIEEAPAPHFSPELRARMGEAALKIARAVSYQSAGTVEFILDAAGEFYFLEVNTRLQVEHAITEAITGLDLVKEQLLIASGEPLSFKQGEVALRGAAIECRLYAENPASDFLPSSGVIADFSFPKETWFRLDSGYDAGSEVGIDFDPMLAKLISWGDSRDEALRRMQRALRQSSVQGLPTNLEFLKSILWHPAFSAGSTHTHFIQEHFQDPTTRSQHLKEEERLELIAAACLYGHERRREGRALLPHLRPGFRNNRFQLETISYEYEGNALSVRYQWLPGHKLKVELQQAQLSLELIELNENELYYETEQGVRRSVRVVEEGSQLYLRASFGQLSLKELPRFIQKETEVDERSYLAPMPGRVVEVLVRPGQTVAPGDVLCVLEAMKMEHSVRASRPATISEVRVAKGQQVAQGDLLCVLSIDES